jgi:hypothetical protein
MKRCVASLAAVLFGLFQAGCGTQQVNVLGSEDDAAASSFGDDADGGTPGAPATDGSFEVDGSQGQSGCASCSPDLHQVVDCSGQVLKTCPSNTGCSPSGDCVAPCDSATANASSIGCEYYALTPDNARLLGGQSGGCYTAFIANTWTTPISITADFDGQSLDISKSTYTASGGGSSVKYTAVTGGMVPPNQVALVFLANVPVMANGFIVAAPPCPGAAVAYATDPTPHGTTLGHAFHLKMSAPVVAYDIYPYGGATAATASATLLLPVSEWDKNYVASYAYVSEATANGQNGTISFVGSQDNTTIAINPTSAIAEATGVAAASKGTTQKYAINAGQVLQFEQTDDLTGSVVLADKPIGMWGGHQGMYLPADTTGGAADGAHQQIPPVKALGSEYVAVRYKSRYTTEESVPWRIVGAVDGTTLTYEPSAPAGAPTTLARGQLVELWSPTPFVVRSQGADHPFYFAGHMTGSVYNLGMGATAVGGEIYPGDPETVNVIPPAQFMSRYVFFTDPTYSDTNLVVVRHAGGADVSLDCMGSPLTGWKSIGLRYQYTRVDLAVGGAPVGSCSNGRHVMTSNGPFGLTVWGWDNSVSYAYPAGASLKPINTVVVQPTIPR